MIKYKQVGKEYFTQYDSVPMRVIVESCCEIEEIDRGLGGFLFVEKSAKPYVKDFCSDGEACAKRWDQQFDTSNWAFFMAFDGSRLEGQLLCHLHRRLICFRDEMTLLFYGIFGLTIITKCKG